MADDMKKLVEKYKRELMEYSSISSSEKPSPLRFPEMIADSSKEGGADNKPMAQVPQQTPMPQTSASVPNNARRSPSSPNTAPENSESFQNDDVVMRGDFKDVLSKPEDNTNKTPSGNDNIRDPSAESPHRLSETPISGQNPDEQFGRRNFENTPETGNSRSDIKPLETQTNGTREMQPEQEYTDLQDFYNINNKRGTLSFRVYTAREALPVTGAVIEVTKVIGNNKHTFYKLTTDISGNTPVVYLPAPSSELSQYPENTIQPYALYDVYITADNFRDVSIKNLPIFDGILSKQSIAMVPILPTSKGGTPRQITENGPGVNGGVY